MILLAIFSGIFGIIASLALRRDTPGAAKLRAGGGVVDERFVLLSLPGFSLMLLAGGILGAIAPGIGGWLGNFWGPILAVALGAIMIFGLVISVMGLGKGPIPKFLRPKWKLND